MNWTNLLKQVLGAPSGYWSADGKPASYAKDWETLDHVEVTEVVILGRIGEQDDVRGACLEGPRGGCRRHAGE